MAGLLLSVWVAHLPRPALGASEGLWMVAGLSRVAVLSVETSSSGLRDLGQGSTTVTKVPEKAGQTRASMLPSSHLRNRISLCQRG